MPGFLDIIFGGPPKAITRDGEHNISVGSALARTHDNAIDPVNPPNWENGNIHTRADLDHFRDLTWEESEVINMGAETREAKSRNFQKALNALKRWDKADASDQQALRDFQISEADNEYSKRSANAKLVKHLHGQRPKYAELFQASHNVPLVDDW